ncbi:aspartate/glutamate racemase family protein [Acidobacteriota bacterium]
MPKKYGYMTGATQPDWNISIPKGQAIAGHAVGILVLDLHYPYFPGNVANATTFDFPVLYKVLKGAGDEILKADPSLLDKVIAGGKELEEQGVRAIVGSCGYFGNYQREAAAALDVPVFLSSLMQVPLIMQSIKADQKVGILCAVKESLSPKMLESCGITELSRIAIGGAQDIPDFQRILQFEGQFNSRRLEEELVKLAKQLVNDNPEIGALLIECTDMPPYAWAIQDAINLPVFDYITLINWINQACVRKPFAGFI